MSKIADEKKSNGQVFAFHSTKTVEMYDIIASRQFSGGGVGGQMLGPGFYCNYFIKQAKLHKYGNYIFCTKLLNTDKFLCLNADMYKHMYGKKVSQKDPSWVEEQFTRNNIPTGEFEYKAPFCYPEKMSVFEQICAKITRGDKPSSYNWPWWNKLKQAGFRGLIYTGGWDAESFVVWYIDDVIPIGVTDDDGRSWKKPHTALKEAMDQENHNAMRDANLNSKSEYRRSMQYAYDMQTRASEGGWDEARLVKHILSSLQRMRNTDQYKQVIRRDAFLTVFPELAKLIEE